MIIIFIQRTYRRFLRLNVASNASKEIPMRPPNVPTNDCKNVGRSIKCVRRLCDQVHVIALHETGFYHTYITVFLRPAPLTAACCGHIDRRATWTTSIKVLLDNCSIFYLQYTYSTVNKFDFYSTVQPCQFICQARLIADYDTTSSQCGSKSS